jgi:uncharacterized protein YfbU (UPF0304 family)
MEMSNGEKLIAIMLADIMQANGITGEVDPAFIKEAISGGHLWALEWQYSGLFHDEEPGDEVVQETADILSMCSFLEYSINELDATDRATIPEHDRTVFEGFDANNEPHYGVARMMIEEMGRWTEFKGRPINSHAQILHRYRQMLERYNGNGASKMGGLKLDEIVAILSPTPFRGR